jgi:hypothetical protein
MEAVALRIADRVTTADQYGARWRSLANLLKMGHCAPSVMQTVLDVTGNKQDWLVKLSAGLPGGIGNAGFECGGVTAPLVLLGFRYGLQNMHDGLPEVFYAGHAYCQEFRTCKGTLFCKDIRGERRLPIPCIGAVRYSPELYIRTTFSEHGGSLSGEKQDAFRRLYGYLSERGFHCAHLVLRNLGHIVPLTQELLDATSAFMGGTLFQGYTCSALTAGIMAVGLRKGTIEDSRLRVIRMMATMALGGNAFEDDMNEFSRIMNIGERMSAWFRGEYGSTQCRAVTGCDFSTVEGANNYAEGGCATKCRTIAQEVARKVESIVGQGEPRSAPVVGDYRSFALRGR